MLETRGFSQGLGRWLAVVWLMLAGAQAWAGGIVTEWGLQTGVSGGFTNVTAVAAGDNHTLGLLPGGYLTGWGNNVYGQLNYPYEVQNGGVLAIAAGGDRSYAILSDGTLSAWGSGGFFGFGWSDLTSISAYGFKLLGATSTGSVLVSGYANPPAGLTGVIKVAAGESHALALKGDGTVVAWGQNFDGQCDVPAGLSGVIAIAAGEGHSLALKSNGTVVAWGAGAGSFINYGQSLVPAGLSGVTGIAAGHYHSVALKSDGTVVSWGDNSSGQLNTPAGLGPVQAVTAGSFRTVAIVTPFPDIRVFHQGVRREYDGNRHDFGVVNPGASLTHTFAISNYGSATLSGLSLSKDGVSAPRFTVSALSTTSLAPGAFTTFTVTFSPDVQGASFAAIHLTSNDADEGMFDINLTGRTLLAAVTWPESTPGQGRMLVGMADLREVSSGGSFGAVLRSDGRIMTWGGDQERGFHNYTLQDAANPVKTFSLGPNEQGILVKTDGAVCYWTPSSIEGQFLAAGSTVSRVSAGGDHFLAMKADGTVLAFGDNTFGQINVPAGTAGSLAISAGSYHSVLVAPDGTVKAWGKNTNGQCDVPPGLKGVVDVAAGSTYTLAVKADGSVVGWGMADYGQLSIPAGLSNVLALAVDYTGVYALKTDGSVTAWGSFVTPMPAFHGRAAMVVSSGRPLALVAPAPEITITESGASLPDGSSADFSWTPLGTPVTKTFTIGNNGSVALSGLALSKGGLNPGNYTLGALGSTSLAPGTTTTFTVTFSPSFTGASVATLQLASNDPDENPFDLGLVGRTPMSVVGWGWNLSGQVDPPPGLGDVVALAAGYNHSLALRSNGTVVAWGENSYGQCNVPAGLTGVKAISAGWYHSVALKTNGTVVCWGEGGYQQLQVPAGLSNVTAISAGAWHTVALKADGTAVAWGLNVKGQLNIPSDLAVISHIAGGYDHSLVSFTDEIGSRVLGVGSNTDHQSDVYYLSPRAIAAGDYHNLALNWDGTVSAWGRSTFGEIAVPSGLSGVTAISAGVLSSGALKQDGSLVLWGANSFGKSTVPANLGSIGGLALGGNHTLALVAPMPDIAVTHPGIRDVDGGGANFGITGTSGSDTRTFTVQNRGTATLTGLALSKDGTDAANFTFTNPLVTTLAPGASTTFTVTFQTSASGTKTAALHLASNDPDESPFDLILSGTTGLSPVEAWRQAWFGFTYLDGNSDYPLDPDSDGVSNLAEFAFGTNPTAAPASPLIYTGPYAGGGVITSMGTPTLLIQQNGGNLDVSGLFLRRKDAVAATLTYTPQISADLASWTTVVTAPTVLASNSTHELAAVPFPALLNGEKPRFFRVVVELVQP